MSLAAMMSRQRDLRLAKEALVAKSAEQGKVDWSASSPEEATRAFWDRVDTSGGVDACHLWTGRINSTWATYEVGEFEHPTLVTKLAHRAAVALTFGLEPDVDIIPICDNRLCCNMRHLAAKLDGKTLVPIEEFFHCEAA